MASGEHMARWEEIVLGGDRVESRGFNGGESEQVASSKQPMRQTRAAEQRRQSTERSHMLRRFMALVDVCVCV